MKRDFKNFKIKRGNVMSQNIRIGYFEHWHQPPYKFTEFLQEQKIEFSKIDYSQKGYLENFDVAIIEQNGFNDYIENDELYIQDWVRRGGILFFMHQSYQRWAPFFLPTELGYTQLIHRYVPTINGFCCAADPSFTNDDTPYMLYMMPWIEDCGKRLFSEPEVITPDEMLHWNVTADSFGITHGTNYSSAIKVRSAAQSCYLAPDNWEIIGSYMDPGVKDGALILRAKYGKGMYFLNQLLFPETNDHEAGRSLAFWKKYIKNLLAYFERFKSGESEEMPKQVSKTLPLKRNYKMPIHMHSLDWYGADSSPGTINAIMRYMKWDICSIAIKDNAPYEGKLDTEKYSDDKVLFLDGQEYHPFNWNDKYEHLSHNTYHMLAIGIDPDAYTTKFTRSFHSDEEIATYLKECVEFVHEHNGAITAAHPDIDYWKDYDIDGVDMEPLHSLAGTYIEKQWLAGKRFAATNSVDLYGPRRALDNPAVNFIYLNGETPCRDSVVRAIRAHHIITACGFDEADITLNGHIPGEEIPKDEAMEATLDIFAKVSRGVIEKIRVYSGAELIFVTTGNGTDTIKTEISLKGFPLNQYVRVELEGMNEHLCCNTTPFWIR